MRKITLLLAATVTSLAAGCGGYARTPDQWSQDTYKLLEAQSEPIKSCYTKSLRANPKLEGSVVVSFVIENKTGRLRKAKIDNSRTTAGEPARKCVLDSLRDLKVTPPDANNGKASYTWEFKAVVVKEDGTPADAAGPPGT